MIPPFDTMLKQVNPEFARFQRLLTLQVNVGNRCNQCCRHCHVAAGPRGDRTMSADVAAKIVQFLSAQQGVILDITGGCPELAPCFTTLVEKASPFVPRIMVRTNLTILTCQGMEWLYDFYRTRQVVIIASLPCYTEENVDSQRGNGVFEKSIRALGELNNRGYGDRFELNLVYNPLDDFLPGTQEQLEQAYRKELLTRYGITFNHLFTVANAPLGRFAGYLEARGRTTQYLTLLSNSFNPAIAEKIMCRTLINVDWHGTLYNCDFNQAAGLPIRNNAGEILTLDDISNVMVERYEIATGDHCYSCTAGEGSSCTGKLAV